MSDRRSEIEATLAGAGKRWHWRRWISVALVAGLIAGAAWWTLSSGTETSAGTSYRTELVTRTDLTVTITATGTIEPLNVVEISSELSGTLTEVNVDFNETVEAGEVLARLDTTQLEAQLAVQRANHASASAQLASARTTLEEARDAYTKSQSLFERAVVTQSALDTTKAALERADAAYQVAAANLDLAHANYQAQTAELAKAKITSPIAGVVLDVAAEPGQIVAASLSAPTLFTIAEDLAKMQLQADVAEADIGQVSVGDPATFTVEAYDGITFPATIIQVRFASEITDGLVTYKAILSVDNPDLKLRPGMTAVTDIVVASEANVLTVPNSALRYAHPVAVADPVPAAETDEGGNSGGLLGMLMPARPGENGAANARADGKSVWVLRDGQPVQIAVTPGATDGSRTAVTSEALREGDRVITARLTGG